MAEHEDAGALVPREGAAVVQASNLLEILANACVDPRVDPAKLRELFQLQKEMMAEQAKALFIQAMSRAQDNMPRIQKKRAIKVKGVLRSKYANIEDIDDVLRPILKKEGLAVAYDCKHDGKYYVLSCTVSHNAGHSETKTVPLPLDSSDYRSPVQNVGSTVSYGKRTLLKMHFNIIEEDEDDDGNGGGEYITEDQALDLIALADEIKADKAKFLELFDVDAFDKIPARDHQKALNWLNALKRNRK